MCIRDRKSAIAIGIHNFPEGMVTFMTSLMDPAMGLSIAVAIAMHNIPEGIGVAAPIYFATGDKKRALWLTFLSGVSEPVGAILAYLLLRPFPYARLVRRGFRRHFRHHGFDFFR